MWTHAVRVLLVLVGITVGMAEEPIVDPDSDLMPTEADYQAVGRSGEVSEIGTSADVGSTLVTMLGSLILVVGIAVALGLALRRLGATRRWLHPHGRHMEVIESVPLGLKRSITLVRIGGQVLVVGHGEQQMAHLATLDADAVQGDGSATVAEPLATVPPDDNAAVSGFQERLRSLLGKRS